MNNKNGSILLPIHSYRVIDGDTVEVYIDIEGDSVDLIEGLIVIPKGIVRYIIRMIGINAPEMSDGGDVAKNYLRESLLNSNKVSVELFRGVRKKIKFQKDRYGRMLGYIYADDVNMSDDMIKSGNAIEYIKK